MKTVIEMAREAGAHPSHNPELYDIWSISDKALERFASLVRADEREAIAKWLEDEKDAPYWAELVRARSNT
jgi:hypothetical protein